MTAGAQSVITLAAMTRRWRVLVAACLLSSFVAGQQPPPSQPFNPDTLRQQELKALLARTGEATAHFLEEFSDVKCTELVTQEKLGNNGKIEIKKESAFDYLAILTSAGGSLSLSESRLPVRQSKTDKNVSLLVSNGFGTLFLVFHPYYQGSFQFTALDNDVVAGRQLARIAFRHIPGTRSPMALVLRGREYPLDLSGTAWIDPASGAINRIEAGLENGIQDLGLQQFRSEVQFAPVSFRGSSENDWFPSVATIEVDTPKQRWRNIHRFTDYKRFSVSTEEAVSNKQ